MARIEEVVSSILPLQEEILIKAQKRLDNLTKPLGSLGRLEEVAKKVAAITENLNPSLNRKVIFVFAADHGVADNFLRGGAGINVLAKHIGAKVVVVDTGVARDLEPHPHLKAKKIGYGTRNMVKDKYSWTGRYGYCQYYRQ